MQYSPRLQMCLSDSVTPIKFNVKDMIDGGPRAGECGFCAMGRDIDYGGDYEFGEMWADAAKFRKK